MKLKKISFEDFCEWINYRFKKDSKYEKNSDFYSLIFMFEKNIITLHNKDLNINILDNLKPIYPWSEKWLNFFDKTIEKTILLEKQNILLKKKIKDLENKIIFLEKNKDPYI